MRNFLRTGILDVLFVASVAATGIPNSRSPWEQAIILAILALLARLRLVADMRQVSVPGLPACHIQSRPRREPYGCYGLEELCRPAESLETRRVFQ